MVGGYKVKKKGSNMNSLVELYPDLFVVKPNSFFEKDELDISYTVDLAVEVLKKCAIEYAVNSIEDPDNNYQAVEVCKDRFIDGACWYATNFTKLNVLTNKKYDIVLKTASSIYARDYCKNVHLDEEDYTREDAALLKDIVIDDFREGVKYAEFNMMCKLLEDIL
jgi:hypothetical protein